MFFLVFLQSEQTVKFIEMENPIDEARRYVSNAKDVIKNANYDRNFKMYMDGKYVKMAGDTLWKGCLIALDAVLNIRKGKGRPSIDKYKEAAGKRDQKLLAYIVTGYDTMHLHMGYDGTGNKRTCDSGFDYANMIIDRCALLMPEIVSA